MFVRARADTYVSVTYRNKFEILRITATIFSIQDSMGDLKNKTKGGKQCVSELEEYSKWEQIMKKQIRYQKRR